MRSITWDNRVNYIHNIDNMRKVKAIVEGKEVELTLTKEQEMSVFGDCMEEIYKYHNTTKQEFDEKYKGIPDNLKALQQEFMIVAFYNKGVKVNFEDLSYKYTPYFIFQDGVQVFHCVVTWRTYSYVPTSSLFLREDDCKEAVEKYLDVYRRSRV